MDIRKIWPTAVNLWLSRVSRTQPVPSIAACSAGSASTPKMTSAGASMMVVALTRSSAMSSPPHAARARLHRRLGRRERDGELRAAFGGVARLGQSAQSLREAGHERQPDTGADPTHPAIAVVQRGAFE